MVSAEAPADTRMMGIVHGALRRDLLRMRDVLTTQPPPMGRQRKALAEHVQWLMDFLHHHHSGEDQGLWPLVRARAPEAGSLLASLEAEHATIAPRIEALLAAGRAYGGSTGDAHRVRLIEALDELTEVLLPHLDREVDEGMPVVAAALSQREWHRWDQAYNLRGKSPRELGLEGHWLIDGLDPQGRDVVLHEVPAIPRFVLVHGFARAYRRQSRGRWQPDKPESAAAGGPSSAGGA